MQPPEECDDGNLACGDGCSSECKVEKRCCVCEYMPQPQCGAVNAPGLDWSDPKNICPLCRYAQPPTSRESACTSLVAETGQAECRWDTSGGAPGVCINRFEFDCNFWKSYYTDPALSPKRCDFFSIMPVGSQPSFGLGKECKTFNKFYSGHGRGLEACAASFYACLACTSGNCHAHEDSCSTFQDENAVLAFAQEIQSRLAPGETASITAAQAVMSPRAPSWMTISVSSTGITTSYGACEQLGDNTTFGAHQCFASGRFETAKCYDAANKVIRNNRCCPYTAGVGASCTQLYRWRDTGASCDALCPDEQSSSGTCKASVSMALCASDPAVPPPIDQANYRVYMCMLDAEARCKANLEGRFSPGTRDTTTNESGTEYSVSQPWTCLFYNSGSANLCAAQPEPPSPVPTTSLTGLTRLAVQPKAEQLQVRGLQPLSSSAPDTAAQNGARFGAAAAPITIEMFQDLKCGMCRHAFQKFLPEILGGYLARGEVRLVFREFPLIMREEEIQLAEAAQCAGEQHAYVPYLEQLYGAGKALDPKQLPDYASRIGIDRDLFLQCLGSGHGRAVVERDRADGEARNIEGTPTFFINGERVDGVGDASRFRDIIDRALQARAAR